jgi:hypothetical protein
MDKRDRSRSKSRSRSRRQKRIKQEKEVRLYHSAHGQLSTNKEIDSDEVRLTTGYPETHFINGEKEVDQVYPIKVEKDVSGINVTIIFKINSDMYTSTLTGDDSKAETEGDQINNLSKFHTLFTIEAKGSGSEFIIKKVFVHSPSIVEGMTSEEHVAKKTKYESLTYKSSDSPPVIFYDGKMKSLNVPNLEFFYEATFNTGMCGIDSNNQTQRLSEGKLWWKTDMMKLNKISNKPGLETFPINKEENSCGSSPPPCSPQQSVTLQDMFKEMNKLDEYDRILDEYYITPATWKKDDNEDLIDSIKFELSEYLEEASKIYFHHPDSQKSLLSAALSKATFRSISGDNLSVTIFNSTCLVNQKRNVGEFEVFTENPIEDRLRYPDFYKIYEGPMDRSILLYIDELSSDITEANREIDGHLKMIKMREKWIQEDEDSLKKAKKSNFHSSCKIYEDNITKFKKEIKEKGEKIKKLVSLINYKETQITIANRQKKAQKQVKTLDSQIIQPGVKRGRLKINKERKRTKRKKRKQTKRKKRTKRKQTKRK